MTKAKVRESISVFFPVFNDQKTIVSLTENALAVLADLTDDYEVLLINDGSTDASAAVADDLARNMKHVRVIHHSCNRGYGAALRSGFSNATKELIFYTDGDGQYDVSELALLVPQMREGVDVVNGYKIERHDNRGRKASGAIYNRLARFFFRLPISDVDCDFRLVRRAAIERIPLGLSSGAICVELVRKLTSAGCTFRELPVHHYPRLHGKSQFFTPRRVARTVFDFVALWLSLRGSNFDRAGSVSDPDAMVDPQLEMELNSAAKLNRIG
jgi:glycosyltransferase involved in cell wall biosynthesis